MRATRRGLGVLILTLLAAPIALADLAAKPDAYTEANWIAETLEYYRKTVADPYKEVGKKNPAWDAQVTQFLEAASVRFATSGAGVLHQIEVPKLEETIKQGDALIKMGCDDPMVLYCYSGLLEDAGRRDEAKPVLQQAYKGLLTSKYPMERSFFAANRLLRGTEEARERMAITAEMEKLRPKLLSIKFINSAHRRRMAHFLWETFPATPPAKRLAFYEEMKNNKQADQWIVNLFGGRHFIKAAWDARGGAWAKDVKKEGWMGFEENLSRARECLVAAWKIAPNLPEAPAEMITVTMGQGQRKGEDLRTWFDRAVDAQFDHRDAYSKLRYALLPRWHGSHEEILALGIECFRTGRFDTGVPYQLVECLESIRDDRGGDMSFWDQAEIYEMMRDVMVQYAKKTEHKPDWHDWYISYAAALANRMNRHEESRKFLEQIKEKVAEKVYWNLRQLPNISVSESYLLSGPFAQRFNEALELQKSAKHEEASAAIEKLMKEMPRDDKGLIDAQFHLDISQRELKMASGEWVDLTPGIDRVPWGPGFGQWSMTDDKGLVGESDSNGIMTLLGGTVPARYEFTAQIEIKKSDIEQPGAGLVLNFTGWQNAYAGAWVYPNDRKLLTRGREDEWHEIKCGSAFELTVQVIDDRVTVLVDGKEAARFRGVGRPGAPRMTIGLSGMYQTPGGTAVFRGMKVRRIEKGEEGK